MGDERSIPPANTQYPGVEHQVLKKWTDEGEPGDANGIGDMYKDFASGLTEAAENLMVAVFGSQAGWTGQAANAMRERLQKVAEWSQKTGDSFGVASSAFVSQGESVGSAKTSMPDPVDYNPGQMIKDAAKSGSIVDIAMLPYNMYQTRQAQQQAHEKAIQVVAQRDAELASAAASIPPFEPPPKIEDPGGKEPGPNGPGMPGAPGGRPGMPGGGSRGGIGGGGGGGGAGGAGGGGIGGGGGMPGFPGGGMGGGSGFGPDDPNNPNGNGDDNQGTPPNVGMPSLPVGSGTGTSGFAHTPTNFGGGGPGGFPPGGIPGGAGPAGGGGGFGGAFGGGFGPGGAPRPGGGFGPMGPGAAAGGAGGAGAGAGAGAGSGMGGAGAGGRGAGMAGGRGAGGMGAGGMGAGRGEGGEDDEHQRPSYLVEPDPDATFGSDQMTAPPVIGG
jgi:hypothetical protein